MKSALSVTGKCGVASIVTYTTLARTTSAENRKVRKYGNVIRVIFVSFLLLMMPKDPLYMKIACKRPGMSWTGCLKSLRCDPYYFFS